ITFDEREAVDDMAEGRMHGFQRILGLPVCLRLTEADVGEFALDEVDQSVISGLRQAALLVARERSEYRLLVFGELPQRRMLVLDEGSERRVLVVSERRQRCVLVLEVAQDVLKSFLDVAEIAGALIAGRRFQSLQQIGHALLEMSKGGS